MGIDPIRAADLIAEGHQGTFEGSVPLERHRIDAIAGPLSNAANVAIARFNNKSSGRKK